MTKRVFFYVQHLWGVGHVYRATRIAHGLKNAGLEVHLVWGGTQLPGFDFSGLHFHPLTPVRTSDASFSQLLHADGSIFTDTDKEQRKESLLALYDEISPNILITEAFPFGRRQMRFELLPLLERATSANPKPLIAASIRDIMQENRKPARVEESNKYVADYFDLVLVHGDQKLIKIEETLQGTETFADKIRYTGLVTPEEGADTHSDQKSCNVLVSVGGGAFGKNLAITAIKAASQVQSFRDGWLVTTGTEMPEEEFRQIQDSAPEGVKVIRHITDMVGTMKQCRVSVSHAGYNTVGDILRAGCASVLYPYTGGRETEQLRRAEMMQELGIAKIVRPEEFSAAVLANAIDEAAHAKPASVLLDINGARQTAEILIAHIA